MLTLFNPVVYRTNTYVVSQLVFKTPIMGANNYEVISYITGEVHFFNTLPEAEAFVANPANLE